MNRRLLLLISGLLLVLTMVVTIACAQPAAPAPSPSPAPATKPAPVSAPSAAPSPTQALTWKPSGTIRWICLIGAGGGFDQWSRAIAKTFQKYVGVPVMVDNVVGGGGVVGTETLWRSKPDGQTIEFLDVGGMLASQYVLKPSYNILEMSYIGVPRVAPFVMWANKKSPHNTVQDFVNAGKTTKLRGGTTGLGASLWHSMAIFANEAGIDVQPVAGYNSGADAFVGLEAGDFELIFMPTQVGLPMVNRGAIKAVATAGNSRDDRLPGVQTFVEAGYPKTSSYAITVMLLAAPPATPPAAVSFLEKALLDTCSDPEYLSWVKTQGESLVPLNASQAKDIVTSTNKVIVEFLPILSKYIK